MDEGTTMKSVKAALAMALMSAMSTTTAVIAPPAHADMPLANYDVLTNRYDRASWVWFVSACPNPVNLECLRISATPRLKFYAYYAGYAHIENGQYVLRVDVPDGLQCLPGYAMPTHETWTWDRNTFAGNIDSEYDVGCFNGPPGSQSWTFQLQRL
jgi:hypothetical protein